MQSFRFDAPRGKGQDQAPGLDLRDPKQAARLIRLLDTAMMGKPVTEKYRDFAPAWVRVVERFVRMGMGSATGAKPAAAVGK